MQLSGSKLLQVLSTPALQAARLQTFLLFPMANCREG